MPWRPSKPPVNQLALFADFLQQQADAERDHDQWQVAKPGNDEARHIAEQAGRHCCDEKSGERLAPAPFGNQPGGIGASAEISGVAERHDAGEAENEIKRKHE